MPLEVNLDVMLAKRKMTLTELSNRVGITIANLSILKKGKAGRYVLLRSKLFAKNSNASRAIFFTLSLKMAKSNLCFILSEI
jgi:hypothetical protein